MIIPRKRITYPFLHPLPGTTFFLTFSPFFKLSPQFLVALTLFYPVRPYSLTHSHLYSYPLLSVLLIHLCLLTGSGHFDSSEPLRLLLSLSLLFFTFFECFLANYNVSYFFASNHHSHCCWNDACGVSSSCFSSCDDPRNPRSASPSLKLPIPYPCSGGNSWRSVQPSRRRSKSHF